MKTIAMGCDHGGFALKEHIKLFLEQGGYTVRDYGTTSADATDFPIYANEVCDAIVRKDAELGILCCGTGIGMSIAANKRTGIRAALLSDTFSAKVTREHNDTNVCCLGQRVIGPDLALSIVEAWLSTEFLAGKYQRRIDMIEKRNEK